MSALESKNGGQAYSVRFAQPLNEQISLPISRVDSMTSSGTEYADAVDEWLADERTALISTQQNNGHAVNVMVCVIFRTLNLNCPPPFISPPPSFSLIGLFCVQSVRSTFVYSAFCSVRFLFSLSVNHGLFFDVESIVKI
jgi:hypothetical protein